MNAGLLSGDIRVGEAQLRAILTAMPLDVALYDHDLRYVGMSARFRARYPFTVPDPVGRRAPEVHEFFPDLWKERLKRTLRGEELGMEEEPLEIIPGAISWLRWRTVPWRDPDGEIGGVVLIVEDISDQKENDMRLRQATKLTALGEMAGGIAHEINNPLSILRGFVDLMQRHMGRDYIDPEVFRQYLMRSRATIDRISRIVSGMRRISRDSSKDSMQPYAVNALLDDALDFVQEKFRGHGIRLDVLRAAPDELVVCRPVEISQVLLNLLTNSFHALEGRPGGWVRIGVQADATRLCIQVEDGGAGVPEELREKIFQPFFTTKDIGKGMGLGLSVSRRILESHGGRLFLEPRSAHTCFVLELPHRS